MLFFFISVIFATAAGITAFLLMSSGNIKNFKKCFGPKAQITQLPIITEDGNFVDTKEELEAHLEVLQNKLLEKVDHLETSKTKVYDAKESIDKLHSTQAQVKKYYIKLKDEIRKSEDDCKNLQSQIENYRVRRIELAKEMKENEEYYQNLLNVVKSGASVDASPVSSKTSLSTENSTVATTVSECDNESATNKKYRRGKIPVTSINKLLQKSAPVSAATSDVSLTNQPCEDSAEKMSESSGQKRPKTAPFGYVKTRLQMDQGKSSLPRLSKTSLISPKVRKTVKKALCCCGNAKCTGTCNIARCIRLGLVKPGEILSSDIADHVDIVTGKIVCEQDSFMQKRKKLSSR